MTVTDNKICLNGIKMLHFLIFLGFRPTGKWIQVLATKQIPKGRNYAEIRHFKINIKTFL